MEEETVVANHKEMAFFHGTMGSRKSLELMLDQYRRQEKMHHNTLIIKPGEDLKAGGNIQTRAFGGEEREALIMPSDAEATEFVLREMQKALGARATWTIYLDEVNLFTGKQVESLRSGIVDEDIADVNMYGLITDAFGHFFPGSEAALKLSDRIVQLDNICDNEDCDRPAMRNARIVDGHILRDGPQIAIDGVHASYMALCHKDYIADVVRPGN